VKRVHARHAKKHLRLMVNEHDGRIFGRVEFVVLVHLFSSFVLWIG